jgi:hypothetical protein
MHVLRNIMDKLQVQDRTGVTLAPAGGIIHLQ